MDGVSQVGKLAGEVDEVWELSKVSEVSKAGEGLDDISRGAELPETESDFPVVSKYSDIYNYEYNGYTNPGPLSEIKGEPIRNFYGGRYNIEVTERPIKLYRAGKEGSPLGKWFTEIAPDSEIQVRIDTAVKPIWTDAEGFYQGSSPIDKVYEIEIPSGTTIYRGPVGSQGGIYQGGLVHEQIFIDEPWKLKDLRVLNSYDIRRI